MPAEPESPTRERVEQLLAGLPGGQLAFNEPWELRALALAVAAHDAGQYPWADFQAALIRAIGRWEADPDAAPWRYYERWLEALESLLADTGALSGPDVDTRTATVLATPKGSDHSHGPHREPIAVDPARSARRGCDNR